ncbi:MAG: carbon-nitrogen hydrolase family protein [Chloroflexota bacterium]
MARKIKVATIQLDGAPQVTDERLNSIETSIAEVVSDGAELLVLPAFFNTGKTFLETTYEKTERLTDQTMLWMCEQAQKHNIHLVGAWLVVDKDDTYQSAILVTPDGKTYRYNQQYPLMWERVFYRDGRGITIADTEVGRIGMMIGWDVAHPELWERYASKVDLMLILHAEIDYTQATLQYPDGAKISHDQLSVPAKFLIQRSKHFLQQDISTQRNWLNVPTVTVGCSGEFDSILPAPYFSVQALLFGRTALWQKADTNQQYAEMRLIAPFTQCTEIRDANGEILTSTDQDGTQTLFAQIDIGDADDHPPLPLDEPQPATHTSEWVRLLIDSISSGLLTLNYRRGVRRQWGARMAPMDASTRVWLQVILIVAVLAMFVGRFLIPKRC